MGIFRIYVNKFKEIKLDRMNMLASRIASANNKSVSYVKRDMVKNFLVYKIGYTDYFKSDFINLTKEQKKDFVTSKNYISILSYLNPKPYRALMNDKLVFNRIYRDYLKRDFIDVRTASVEMLSKFLKGKKNVFAKPTTEFGGEGIEKIKVSDVENVEEFKKKLISNKQFLLEEEIIQHDVVKEINPYAVNTLRILTLYKDGVAHIITNAFRISMDYNPAIQCRDSYTRLDVSGNVLCKFTDDDGTIYDKHPLTGFDFSSIDKIPYIKEAFDMVKEAALLVPNIRYVGWDVAICKDGPCIIEGNEIPSYGIVQYFLLDKSNPGHLKQIRDIIGDEINNIKL